MLAAVLIFKSWS